MSVLRTKLSKNDCHGTWFQSWQCYQRPPAQQWFNGWTSVHPCLCTLEGRENHLSLTELPRQHAMLTQDVLRTKLSRNDCYGTWSPSRQCYQGPQTERKLKGVHLCAPLSVGLQAFLESFKSQDRPTKNIKKLMFFSGFGDFRSFLESFQCQDCLTFDTGLKKCFYQATSLL